MMPPMLSSTTEKKLISQLAIDQNVDRCCMVCDMQVDREGASGEGEPGGVAVELGEGVPDDVAGARLTLGGEDQAGAGEHRDGARVAGVQAVVQLGRDAGSAQARARVDDITCS